MTEPIPQCASCNSYGNRIVAVKRGFRIRKCIECGLFFVFPQPLIADLNALYQGTEAYYVAASPQLCTTSPRSSERLNDTLIKFGVTSGRLLDVGCATGALIYHLSKAGWEVYGCDVNRNAVEVGKYNGLSNVKEGTLGTIDYDFGFFDAVHMGDVLEHLPDPKASLKLISRILSKDGILIIRVPNAASSFARSTLFFSRATGFPWAHSEAPYHLFDFSPNNLAMLLERNGFEVLEIQTTGKVSFLYCLGATGFFDDLKKKLKAGGRYQINLQIFYYLPRLLVISVVLFPFYVWSLIADQIKKSGQALVVVARRIP